jgi:hypothetical protein
LNPTSHPGATLEPFWRLPAIVPVFSPFSTVSLNFHSPRYSYSWVVLVMWLSCKTTPYILPVLIRPRLFLLHGFIEAHKEKCILHGRCHGKKLGRNFLVRLRHANGYANGMLFLPRLRLLLLQCLPVKRFSRDDARRGKTMLLNEVNEAKIQKHTPHTHSPYQILTSTEC